MNASRVIRGLVAASSLLLVTACGTPAATPPKPYKPPPPPAAPKAGACRALSYAAASGTSDDTTPISCTKPHTAVTVLVGRLATNLNSPAMQHRLAVSCPRSVRAYVGGSSKLFELSLVEAVWFIPTPSQIAQGANWYRCDLVVVAGPNMLAPLAGTMHHALAFAHPLDHWGTCGTAAPSARAFRRVLCSTRHSWRAVSLVSLPPRSAYLSKAATAHASSICHNIAANAANGALKYSWSFEWPNRQQWLAGQRFGLCWLPRTN